MLAQYIRPNSISTAAFQLGLPNGRGATPQSSPAQRKRGEGCHPNGKLLRRDHCGSTKWCKTITSSTYGSPEWLKTTGHSLEWCKTSVQRLFEFNHFVPHGRGLLESSKTSNYTSRDCSSLQRRKLQGQILYEPTMRLNWQCTSMERHQLTFSERTQIYCSTLDDEYAMTWNYWMMLHHPQLCYTIIHWTKCHDSKQITTAKFAKTIDSSL